ncbi:MAG: FkbM family methyltransferase [Saprospirales bacterium]|nr:FkbM family methyltransferase [Saprospirales bacterium]
MNPIKFIPFSTREAIRRAILGKNHFHDLSKFAVNIGCHVAFDVGAQRGYESILFAKTGMTVFAFEPHRPTFKALQATIRAEGVANVYPFCLFVLNESIAVNAKSLTSFIRAGSPAPDLVKIDTDGDDLKVLAGFPFDTCKPALFSVERDEAGEVAKKLDAEGYKIIYAIYKPVNRWKRAIFSRYSLTPDFQGGEWGDVIGALPGYDIESAFFS